MLLIIEYIHSRKIKTTLEIFAVEKLIKKNGGNL
jgi:hypothetical protein